MEIFQRTAAENRGQSLPEGEIWGFRTHWPITARCAGAPTIPEAGLTISHLRLGTTAAFVASKDHPSSVVLMVIARVMNDDGDDVCVPCD